MRRRIWLQFVASAVLLGRACAQSLDSLPPCGVSCVNSVIAKGFGCASQDNACLCKQQDFAFGVRDCASQSCGADVVPKVNEYVTALCATATRAPPASTQPPASQPPSLPPAQPTTPPPAPTLTSQPPLPPGTTAEPSVAETALSQPVNTAPSNAASESASEVAPTTLSTSTKATVTQPATSTATGPHPSQSDSASDTNNTGNVDSTNGLSVPAKAGIGAAAGVGVIAIALALWLLVRRPKNRARSLQISGPMPGSGRDYSGGIVGMTGKNFSELEMRSRRYEDMVPRQTPRRMI